MTVLKFHIKDSVPFLASRSTADLSHRKPASAGAFHDSGRARRYEKKDTLHNVTL
jgi:hypothetical protein